MTVEPIYAKGYFYMSITGDVYELITFYYYDDENYYISLDQNSLRAEKQKMKYNMQYYLDREIIMVNSKRVHAKVLKVSISLLSANYPIVDFVAKFNCKLKKGINTYVDKYDNEVAEYPYDFVWILPGRIIKTKISGKIEVHDNMLYVNVSKGTKVGGEEKIVFKILN
ncbi:hypothetical protein DFR86_01140 [Acidianus sulfidivorans JP7]|uniref:Uncharacterized protein n=1 Tax=Acidianus sulfidivorans JP7 TaxID=619593 RepID=A0A2U9IJS7_9CREN|nr:hypothetical protein [Acidianus sulfidivorans]AWR96283.1 hypothetical protein DFR86_01140 [Acidianus sulfidivorans JP7]